MRIGWLTPSACITHHGGVWAVDGLGVLSLQYRIYRSALCISGLGNTHLIIYIRGCITAYECRYSCLIAPSLIHYCSLLVKHFPIRGLFHVRHVPRCQRAIRWGESGCRTPAWHTWLSAHDILAGLNYGLYSLPLLVQNTQIYYVSSGNEWIRTTL